MGNSASGEIQHEANSSIQNEQLVIDIETMLKTSEILVSDECRQVLDECRIYKVPYHLRKWNEEAYTPKVISIGPYHHNKEKFQTTEKHKVRYFRSFIQHCYVDFVQLERDDFVKMIMLDATFILELFLKDNLGEWTRDDPMRVEAWLQDVVMDELLLLENQLPFFVIKKLYQLAFPSRSNSLPLIQLTFGFFKYLNIHNYEATEGEIKHLTDLLRFFALPPHNMLPQRNCKTVFPKYSATQLREAGVKFEVVRKKCVLDLSFKEGVLEIPLLEFQDHTEAYVRNIMALEQCSHTEDRYITDFYLILDRLINTDKDVDLLCNKGIIVNSLGDN